MPRFSIRQILRKPVLFIGAAALMLFAVDSNQAQTTQPSGTRQPIVTNQFTTTSGGALQARAPGLFTQQAIAVQQGTLTLDGSGVEDTTPWVRETFDMLFLQFVGIITNLVDSLSLLFGGSNSLSGLLGGSGNGNLLGSVLSNPLTGGAGTRTPLN